MKRMDGYLVGIAMNDDLSLRITVTFENNPVNLAAFFLKYKDYKKKCILTTHGNYVDPLKEHKSEVAELVKKHSKNNTYPIYNFKSEEINTQKN